MKKFYKIALLFILLIFLSTYNPFQFEKNKKKNYELFLIKNIEIKNNFLIKKEEIEKKLKKIYNKNILFIKSHEIKRPLNQLSFLEKIEVKKKYPNTLIINIIETKPIAFLFKDKSKYLIDSSNNLILFQENMNFKDLPSIFGEGAEKDFIVFFEKLKESNFPKKKIENFYYFKIGRWDLHLTGDKVIKLPHKNVKLAIDKSIQLLNREDFKNYNIIDLRVDGKIIVE